MFLNRAFHFLCGVNEPLIGKRDCFEDVGVFGDMGFLGVQTCFGHNPGFRCFSGIGRF
jgi:hypothetical protein